MRRLRAQAAVDFILSYGIALIIIVIAVSIIYKTNIVSPSLTTTACSPSAGFSCDFFALSHNGILTVQMSQATGGEIVIKGVACSSQINATGNRPEYGNVYVTNGISYYPTGWSPSTGIPVFSDAGNTMILNCYSSAGLAKGPLGNTYLGYVWMNYSVPGYGNLTQIVATVNAKYT
jgi:hypothetical protein